MSRVDHPPRPRRADRTDRAAQDDRRAGTEQFLNVRDDRLTDQHGAHVVNVVSRGAERDRDLLGPMFFGQRVRDDERR